MFGTTALADLLGVMNASRSLTRSIGPGRPARTQDALFAHLRGRWSDLFGAKFDVLLYDLTSTYFECDVPTMKKIPAASATAGTNVRTACSDRALVVTPEGLPLAYEMFPGKPPTRPRCGHAPAHPKALWQRRAHLVMDRGIPTEAVLANCGRASQVSYLVGTPKGRLTKTGKGIGRKALAGSAPQLRVKLLSQDGEVYVLAQSGARTDKKAPCAAAS